MKNREIKVWLLSFTAALTEKVNLTTRAQQQGYYTQSRLLGRDGVGNFQGAFPSYSS